MFHAALRRQSILDKAIHASADRPIYLTKSEMGHWRDVKGVGRWHGTSACTRYGDGLEAVAEHRMGISEAKTNTRSGRRLFCALLAFVAAVLLVGGSTVFGSRAEAQVTRSPVLVGAGDIASCTSTADEATARLLDGIGGTVFTVGDNAYESGNSAEFANCYNPTWGRHKACTRPSVGNHEYVTAGASGYFGYFGARAGSPGKGYYSYDRGRWHVVVLNSNCEFVGCGPRSAQVRWLVNDLKRNKTTCTLAYWHHARFSSRSVHGNDPSSAYFWRVLYRHHADVIVSGHEHVYERFALQTPGGKFSGLGIRQFVVGTGGRGLTGFGAIRPNSQVRNATTHGVLNLTLRPDSYAWRFIPVAGQTFTDSGSTKRR